MDAHVPVLLNEVITFLNIKPDGTYLDLTLGRGGHSQVILKQLTTGRLIGVDRDIAAIKACEKLFEKEKSKVCLIHANFVDIVPILKEKKIDRVDGIIMDLGVSSPQFDEAERGFSYRLNGRLDMRMDRTQTLTARELVNTLPVKELVKIFREYGDEPFAGLIAKSIVKAREIDPIKTTVELVDIIKKALPDKVLKRPGHPAKKVFQALRIATNDELRNLEKSLPGITSLLTSPGGRLAVIAFHSGEDRIVKRFFNSLTVKIGNRLNIPDDGKEKEYRLITKKPVAATQKEKNINPRSHSAKMRIIERK